MFFITHIVYTVAPPLVWTVGMKSPDGWTHFYIEQDVDFYVQPLLFQRDRCIVRP